MMFHFIPSFKPDLTLTFSFHVTDSSYTPPPLYYIVLHNSIFDKREVKAEAVVLVIIIVTTKVTTKVTTEVAGFQTTNQWFFYSA